MQRRSFLQKLMIIRASTLAAAMLPYGFARLLSPAVVHDFSHRLRPPGSLAIYSRQKPEYEKSFR